MTRPLIYLIIFSAFAWSCLISITYFLPPYTSQNQLIPLHVTVVLAFLFVAITLTSSTIISAVKAMLPNQKLPHLLVKDSFIASSIISLGCTGLVMLQLLRVASLLNVGAWLAIIGTIFWIRQSISENNSDQPSTPTPKTIRRKSTLRRSLTRRK